MHLIKELAHTAMEADKSYIYIHPIDSVSKPNIFTFLFKGGKSTSKQQNCNF